MNKTSSAGDAYSHSGTNYLTYADGDPQSLFRFDNQFAYADAQLWSAISFKLRLLRADGRDTLRVLDVGCGPGTWLRRIVIEARRLGFKHIEGLGFDIAEAQIAMARELTRAIASIPGVSLGFEIRDATRPFPEADHSTDLTLCLYCVLNHLPVTELVPVIGELARVTRGSFITTVRAIGSTPTAFIDSLGNARSFLQDHKSDRFFVELSNGEALSMPSHLFAAAEFRAVVDRSFVVDSLCGLDLFHSRFSLDPRWNPDTLPQSSGLVAELACLEERYSRHPAFIDRATHLLCVGHPRRLGDKVATVRAA